MLSSQYILDLEDEIVVDLFAGGGGASTGLEMALGRHVDIAINHDKTAISLHKANHPQTKHYCCDVFEVNPLEATQGRPVGLMWASPDCKHFSKAKGGKPVDKKIRSLAWVVIKWAKIVKPRIIMLENVEEFKTWGKLGKDNKPIPEEKGKIFNIWVKQLEILGYKVEWCELRACDYGVPTIRKRFFLIARCDNEPIVWPEATHGDPKNPETKAKKLKPWHTAAECIDWGIPCPSIFERDKPLAENTLRRIALGIKKYVIDTKEPFIVQVNHSGDCFRGQSLNEPVSTLTAKHGFGVVVPVLTSIANWSNDNVHDVKKPLTTVTANPKGGHHALVTAFLAKHYTGAVGSAMNEPVSTVTSIDHNSLITSCLVRMRNNQTAQSMNEPISTITSGGIHHAEVRALLVKYYGNDKDGQGLKEPIHTIPTKDRFGLVTVSIDGEDYAIVDIGFRMLQAHELFAGQGFPKHYKHEKGVDGKPLTKTAQVRLCGNSVPPKMSFVLSKANYKPKQVQRKAA